MKSHPKFWIAALAGLAVAAITPFVIPGISFWGILLILVCFWLASWLVEYDKLRILGRVMQ